MMTESTPAARPATTQPASPAGPMKSGCGGTGNSGPSPSRYRRVAAGRTRSRQRHRDDAARLPLRTAAAPLRGTLRRQRRGESRRHAGRRASHQERLPLGALLKCTDCVAMSDPTAPPVYDDRSLRAERPSRADRDRRRQWLEERELRLDPAAVHQDRFDRLRDAVPANPFRAVARHESDDQPADDRDADHERVAERAVLLAMPPRS